MSFPIPTRKWIPAAAGLALWSAVAGCMEERLTGSTSTGNTGKGAIAGRVLDAEGRGVPHARVRIVPVDHDPGPGGGGEVADVAVSDADGGFRTDSLPDGRYNLFADKDGRLSFRDSVEVRSDSATRIAGDTLKPPGSVQGVVRLMPGHDSRTVFLILMGTTTLTVPKDSIGNFRLEGLAEGEYRLRLLSTLDAYKPLDTSVTVRSGAEAVLPDTLRLAYQPQAGGIPVIDDVSLAYDEAGLAVTLTWGRRDASRVGSYHVYRRHKDSAFARLTQAPIADTVFRDEWSAGIRPGGTYHYAVTALDPHGNEGLKGEPAILEMTAKYAAETVIPASECGVGKCHFDVGPDGSIWVAEADGAVVRHRAPGPVSKWQAPGDGGFSSRRIAVDGEGSIYLLYQNPTRLVKFTPAGDSLWTTDVPTARGWADAMEAEGDTLLVWDSQARVMTKVGRDGRLLGRDTLLASYAPANGMAYPSYKRRIGFYTVISQGATSRVEFHDREGRTVSTWSPTAKGYLRDLEKDEQGNWYVSWSAGAVDIYSPAREPLGTAPTGGDGELKHRQGRLYQQFFPGHRMVRIETGP